MLRLVWVGADVEHWSLKAAIYSSPAPPFRSLGFGRIVPEADMHFASLGRAFHADGRGFSPIEGGLDGGGSVS
jgi:hypothetical protein